MNDDSQAAIIANDLASLVHRIEALPADPSYTDAMLAVQTAQRAVEKGRMDLHHLGMDQRFGANAKLATNGDRLNA